MDDEQKIMKDAFDNIPLESKLYIEKMSDIVDRIYDLMNKNVITDENKIKILNGNWHCSIYNFTLREIVELEVMLSDDIIHIVK